MDVEEHKAFWEQNGGSPRPEDYFPGFEAGWNAAAEALSGRNDIPGDDAGLEQWAKDRAGDHGMGEDAWEWIVSPCIHTAHNTYLRSGQSLSLCPAFPW